MTWSIQLGIIEQDGTVEPLYANAQEHEHPEDALTDLRREMEKLEPGDALDVTIHRSRELAPLPQESLDAIHAALDGREWGADVLEKIGEVMRKAGYTLREP